MLIHPNAPHVVTAHSYAITGKGGEECNLNPTTTLFGIFQKLPER
jgi:hypothetical protein